MKAILFLLSMFLLTSCMSENLLEDEKLTEELTPPKPEALQEFKVVDTSYDMFEKENRMSLLMKIRNVGDVPITDSISLRIAVKLPDTNIPEQFIDVKFDLCELPSELSTGRRVDVSFPKDYLKKDRSFQISIMANKNISYWQLDYTVQGNINIPDWEDGGEIWFTPYDPSDMYDPNNPASPYYNHKNPTHKPGE